MPRSAISLLTRIANSSMSFAVRYWPEDSRRWGQAMLAEMGEVSESAEALSWAAGGLLVFLRAVITHFWQWLRLPAGAGFASRTGMSAGSGPQFPKHSRLATALLLLGGAALLCLPMGRQAVSTIRASWCGFHPSTADQRELEKIVAKAEKEQDARELAFIALIHPDADRALAIADQAVSLDKNLAWIYANRHGYWSRAGLDRLQLAKDNDPDNAYVYLISAHAEGEPLIEKIRNDHTGTTNALAKVLGNDLRWMQDMDRAFRSPKYENYLRRHQELTRAGWKEVPNLSPGIIALGQWTFSVPDSRQIKTYADIRVEQALAAASAGDSNKAESILAEIAAFSNRISVDTSPFEQMLGFGLKKRVLQGYRKLYAARKDETQVAAVDALLRRMDLDSSRQAQSYVGWQSHITSSLRLTAFVLQVSAICCVLLVIAVAVSLILLEATAGLRRTTRGATRWIACLSVDYGPPAFFVVSLILLWSFRPVAAAFEQYRVLGTSNGEASQLFWQLFALESASPLSFFYQPYHLWLLATILLVGIALILLLRALLKRKPQPTIPL